MTMIIRLHATVNSGWLILQGAAPNVFIAEMPSRGVTQQWVEREYGTFTKTTVNISNSEYRRFMRECGVK